VVEALHTPDDSSAVVTFDFDSPPWTVFTASGDAYAVCEMLVDDGGAPVDYRFLHVNEHFAAASGLDDAVGRTALELVPDLEPVWIATYAQVGLGGETLRFEQRSDAMDRWFEVVATPIALDRCFVIVFKDGTDRRREAILADEQERRFRAMADELPVMTWLHDEEGRQVSVNQTFCDFFGVSRADMVDDRWTLLAHPDDTDYADDFSEAIAERRPFVHSVRARRADGLWRTLESWGTPRFDSNGTYLGHIGASIDVTDRVALEAERAELLEREREARHFAELLDLHSARLAASTTEDEVTAAILDHVHEVFGLRVAAVKLADGDGVRILPGSNIDPATVAPLGSMPADADLPGPEVIRTGEEIVVGTHSELRAKYPLLAVDRSGIDTLVALPIRRPSGTVTGALVVGRSGDHSFTATELGLLRELLRRSGDALERAHLHQRLVDAHRQEHAIAARLQDALLPDGVVEHPTVEIVARYLAAEGVLEVGGDWYDTFAWSDGRIGAIVGDVVGHDIEAAAHMGRLRAATGALIPNGPSRTATILEALDSCARGPDGVDFVTAACVVLDTATGELEVACAGHPPPLLVESDGAHRWLDDATSPPIGRLDVDRSVSSTFLLSAGDVVLLYTDGLVERRSRTMSFGMRKLRTVAPTCLEGPLESAVDDIVEQLVGTEAGDDVLLIALRWAGPATDPPAGYSAEPLDWAQLGRSDDLPG